MNIIEIQRRLGSSPSRPCEVWVNRYLANQLPNFHAQGGMQPLPQASPAHWHDRPPEEPPVVNVVVEFSGRVPLSSLSTTIPFVPNPFCPQTILSEGMAHNWGLLLPLSIGFTLIEDITGNIHLTEIVLLKLWLCFEQLDQGEQEVAIISKLHRLIALLGMDAMNGFFIGLTTQGAFCAFNPEIR